MDIKVRNNFAFVAAVHSPLHTTLTIYNVLGEKVRTLVDKERMPGNYQVNWDGKDEKQEEVASGVYFYKLKVENFEQTKKMILIR
jgi:flagellar hook assembly protein FlgD